MKPLGVAVTVWLVLGAPGVMATVPCCGAASVPAPYVICTRSSVGVANPELVMLARYWMKRAAGLAIAPPAATGCHADQLASGFDVPPDRVSKEIALPVGRERCDVSVCHLFAPGPLSSTREVICPVVEYPPILIQSTRTAAPKSPKSLKTGRRGPSMVSVSVCCATWTPSA